MFLLPLPFPSFPFLSFPIVSVTGLITYQEYKQIKTCISVSFTLLLMNTGSATLPFCWLPTKRKTNLDHRRPPRQRIVLCCLRSVQIQHFLVLSAPNIPATTAAVNSTFCFRSAIYPFLVLSLFITNVVHTCETSSRMTTYRNPATSNLHSQNASIYCMCVFKFIDCDQQQGWFYAGGSGCSSKSVWG